VRKQTDFPEVSKTPNVTPILLDVTKQDDIDSAFRTVSEWCQTENRMFVGLIHNAGIQSYGYIETDFSGSSLDESYRIMLWGPFRLTQKFFPLLRHSKGRVITISALSSQTPGCGLGWLTVFKAAEESFTRLVRMEGARLGVAGVIVMPGMMKSESMNAVLPEMSKYFANMSPEYQQVYPDWGNKKLMDYYQSVMDSAKDNALPDAKGCYCDAVEKAFLSKRPKPVYPCSPFVGMSSKTFLSLMKLLPESVNDRMAMLTFATN